MITARALCKQFAAVPVLRSLDVTIARGRITAIVGPNGAGKTTFIKAILGLTQPDSGELLFDGERIATNERYRARIGYMPQIARFPENLTGAELLAFLRELRGTAAADDSLIDALALRPSLDKQLRVLSGGTRQKVNAVAAFMFSPELFIFDEPTAGLDPIAAGVLKQRILAERAAGRTVIITSHILGEIEALADEIVYLHDGQARFAGTLDTLRARTAQPTLERAIASLMQAGVA